MRYLILAFFLPSLLLGRVVLATTVGAGTLVETKSAGVIVETIPSGVTAAEAELLAGAKISSKFETATTAMVGTEAQSKTNATANTELTAAQTAKLPEDQIPLSIESAKKAGDQAGGTTKAMMSMLIVLVLVGTSYYYVRKYKFSNSINKSNTRIKVLSQHYLGPKKSLAIIHVAGESILVGITDQNISMIKSLSLIDDEVPADLPNTFNQTLSQAAGSEPAGATSATKTNSEVVELDEEFSFSNVTENVSKKLKSMRSFS